MQFRMVHNNFNVKDMEESLEFYEKALGLRPLRTKEAPDGSFKIIFLGDGVSDWRLELTWLRDHPQPYDLGENEIHLAFTVQDFDAAHALHEQMGCICYENPAMGIYFIKDPNEYWLEIIPERK